LRPFALFNEFLLIKKKKCKQFLGAMPVGEKPNFT